MSEQTVVARPAMSVKTGDKSSKGSSALAPDSKIANASSCVTPRIPSLPHYCINTRPRKIQSKDKKFL